jgi:hypothetical protein
MSPTFLYILFEQKEERVVLGRLSTCKSSSESFERAPLKVNTIIKSRERERERERESVCV